MILQSFKVLLGKGRAWLLTAPNIQECVQAFLKPVYDLYNSGYRIAFTPFPVQNSYADDLADDVTLFEEQFDIEGISTDLNERAMRVEAEWGLVGGQGYQYIENALNAAGLNVQVIENMPFQNIANENRSEYVNVQYNETIENYIIQYGEANYKLIGNGLLNIAGSIQDPITLNNCQNTFIVQCANNLTSSQYQILTDIILRTKPLPSVCLVLNS